MDRQGFLVATVRSSQVQATGRLAASYSASFAIVEILRERRGDDAAEFKAFDPSTLS